MQLIVGIRIKSFFTTTTWHEKKWVQGQYIVDCSTDPDTGEQLHEILVLREKDSLAEWVPKSLSGGDQIRTTDALMKIKALLAEDGSNISVRDELISDAVYYADTGEEVFRGVYYLDDIGDYFFGYREYDKTRLNLNSEKIAALEAEVAASADQIDLDGEVETLVLH